MSQKHCACYKKDFFKIKLELELEIRNTNKESRLPFRKCRKLLLKYYMESKQLQDCMIMGMKILKKLITLQKWGKNQ